MSDYIKREDATAVIRKTLGSLGNSVITEINSLPGYATQDYARFTQESTQDLISRADATHILACVLYAEASQRGEDANVEDYIPEATAWMSDAPSADRPTGWISVSERLPAEDGEYLVAYPIALGDAETEVDILNYGKPTIPNEKVCGRCWYDYDAMYGDIVYDDVVAWMPLPPVYQGE